MLNPIFSINHMRHMMPMFYDVGHKVRTPTSPGPCRASPLTACFRGLLPLPFLQLRAAIGKRVGGAPAEIDMLNWMGRTALELIGQAGLGYSFDKLMEETPNELGDALKSIMSVPPCLPSTVH